MDACQAVCAPANRRKGSPDVGVGDGQSQCVGGVGAGLITGSAPMVRTRTRQLIAAPAHSTRAATGFTHYFPIILAHHARHLCPNGVWRLVQGWFLGANRPARLMEQAGVAIKSGKKVLTGCAPPCNFWPCLYARPQLHPPWPGEPMRLRRERG